MTTRKPQRPIKEVTTRYVQPPEVEVEEVGAFDPAEETFSQFRAKFGTEGVIVKIYRRTPRGIQYCFSGMPSEIDEEVVRLFHAKQPYASEEGQYTARCFVNGEAREGFPILISPQVMMPENNHNGGMAGQAEVVRVMERMMDRLEQKFQEREPLSSLADAMLKLQQLQPKQELPMEQLMKAIELGKAISGNGESSEWTPLIKTALESAAPLLAGILGNVNRPAAGQVTHGGNTVANPQTENAMLAMAINYLKRKCLAGSNPALYIEIVLDNVEEPNYQRLIHKITTSEFSEFIAVDPEIGNPPYVAFFRALYDGLRSEVEAANRMASTPEGNGGNAPDIADHGGPRKAGGKKS